MILALLQRSVFLFILFASPSFLTHASAFGREDLASQSWPLTQKTQRPMSMEDGEVPMDTAQSRLRPMDLAQTVINYCGFQRDTEKAHISQAAHFLQQNHSDETIQDLMNLAVQYAHEIKPDGKEATSYQTAHFLSQSGDLLEEYNKHPQMIIFGFRALSDNAPHASLDAQDYYVGAFSWIFSHTRNNDTARHIADYSFKFMRLEHTEAECNAIIGHIHKFVIDAHKLRPAALISASKTAAQLQSWEVESFLAGFVEPYAREDDSPSGYPRFSSSPPHSLCSPSYSPSLSEKEEAYTP